MKKLTKQELDERYEGDNGFSQRLMALYQSNALPFFFGYLGGTLKHLENEGKKTIAISELWKALEATEKYQREEQAKRTAKDE